MKKQYFFTCIFLFYSLLTVFSQSPPEGINYQAIIRNNTTGAPVKNKAVSIRMEIDTTVAGANFYWEEHTITSNAYGLINLVIGSSTNCSGNFSSIDWSKNTFLTTKVDTTASGSGYVTISTSSFWSVPYAMYAKSAGNSVATNTTNIAGELPINVQQSGVNSFTVSIPPASSATSGYISKSDWQRFDNKLDTIYAIPPLKGNGEINNKLRIPQNTKDTSGYVTAPGNTAAFKVWKTDGAGNPAWRNDTVGGSGVNAWGINGNFLTTGQFLGTINKTDLVFKTNGIEQMRIDTSGTVGIGTTTLSAFTKLHVYTNSSAGGGGGGIFVQHKGTAGGNGITIHNENNGGGGIYAWKTGPGGYAGRFELSNPSNGSNALDVSNSGGGGSAISAVKSNSGGSAVSASHTGISGSAGYFNNSGVSNPSPTLFAINTGTASLAAEFQGRVAIGSSTVTPTQLYVIATGTNTAGMFEVKNSSSLSRALVVNTNSSSNSGLSVSHSGTGTGDAISVQSSNNNGNTIYAIKNANSGNAVFGSHSGTSGSAGFFITTGTNLSPTLFAATNNNALVAEFQGRVGIGTTSITPTQLYVVGTGTNTAGIFEIKTPSNSSQALEVKTNSSGGNGLRVEHSGTGATGDAIAVVRTNNGGNAIYAVKGGSGGYAIRAYHYGDAGYAGSFEINNLGNANTSPALYAITSNTIALAAHLQGKVGINTPTVSNNAILAIADGHIEIVQAAASATSISSTGGSAYTVNLTCCGSATKQMTDVAGFFSINITGAPLSTASAQATIMFNKPYNKIPVIVITPLNAEAAAVQAYVVPGTTGFDLKFNNPAGSGKTYEFSYMVMETR